MKNLIKKLCALSGVSGSESSVSEYCADFFKKQSGFFTVKKDYNNNVIAVIEGKNAEKTILLDAHLDQIGLVVTGITDDGFLCVDKVGGVDLRTLPDAPVRVHTSEGDLCGVVCCMPPHLSDKNEDKAVSIDNVYIDLGLPCVEVKRAVQPGDTITLYAEPKELLNDCITAGALDNRAGVAALLNIAERISEKIHYNPDAFLNNFKYRIVFLLSCQEEVYATGAKTIPFDYSIDECISVDVSFANQPGIEAQYSSVKLGKGPMLMISPGMSREMYEKLKETAAQSGIEYQIEVCGGSTGTNADYIAVSKSGVKTTVISIPVKNMHSQAEIVNVNDITETSKLICNYLLSGGTQ